MPLPCSTDGHHADMVMTCAKLLRDSAVLTYAMPLPGRADFLEIAVFRNGSLTDSDSAPTIDLGSDAYLLRACYVMSGTDVGYGATSVSTGRAA
eukprot:3368443-Rhodomonas_salina.1